MWTRKSVNQWPQRNSNLEALIMNRGSNPFVAYLMKRLPRRKNIPETGLSSLARETPETLSTDSND